MIRPGRPAPAMGPGAVVAIGNDGLPAENELNTDSSGPFPTLAQLSL